VITSADLVAAVHADVPDLPAVQVIGEPCGRNTAPAVALAAALLLERGEPDAVFFVLPSDHVIGPRPSFQSALASAAELAARRDVLVTFGIPPTRAETGYGYVEAGERLAGEERALAVRSFREKPDRATAEGYLASGHHLWNSGMFAWRAEVVAEGLERHAPGILAPLRAMVRNTGSGTTEFAVALQQVYEALPSISIDYALMERADNVAVLPASFEWNDVGHWLALRDLTPKDAAGNAGRGRVVSIDARDNIVHGEGRLTALLGVSDLVVVTTDRVTLVCPADRAQDVKLLLDRAEAEGLTDLL
jgi:mannose-1-phosphate guanylyltransferase/mannose-6-phosphate isomerase